MGYEIFFNSKRETSLFSGLLFSDRPNPSPRPLLRIRTATANQIAASWDFLSLGYGKLQSAVNIATNSAAEDYKACRKFRLFVKDRTINLHFFVDSGADCSIIPATIKNKQPLDYKLFAANGTEIPTYGIKVLNNDLGLRREFLFFRL
ncbi:transposon Ty3-I Gag-Pol polyprotein [Trichonephila clavipes]|nr:transposon Ty3-I Gag-Pol polyprotein [Trichonephila clavipes]